ncbi:hypothetical protein ACFVS2_25925 [Brevibacillus sp. NPDC058079]|uniref:hypothetical protein n=1 Tax=Brevibacillus sp. NPDC058079 TaxID=3346330 RepID=UPI0036E5C081
MLYLNTEREREAELLLEQELFLDRTGMQYAIQVANAVEEELKKGYCLTEVWDNKWKEAAIPWGANWGGTIYHLLIKFWFHGESLRTYLKEKAPVTSSAIGI